MLRKRRNSKMRSGLALSIGCALLGVAGVALGQATTGTIRGTVPIRSGEAVKVTSAAGFTRTIPVGPSGRYSVTLPVGTYTVTLLRNGKAVQSRRNVSPAAAGSVDVNFKNKRPPHMTARTLAAINVSASAIPSIDVTTTNQVTTITSAELQRLPLPRTAQGIAMLAPGVALGSASLPRGALGNQLVAFGGASVAENAFYIDGMNTTNLVTGQGGVSLPYGAIEQQQTMTAGYGARYGRSIGGVINQIGKSGTNQWHFGLKAMIEPSDLRAGTKNDLWSNPLYTGPNLSEIPGNLEQYQQDDRQQERVLDAYVGGPIIPSKLTFFLAVEQDRTSGQSNGSTSSPFTTTYHIHQPKLYGKISWNINNNNILSVTAVQNSTKEWQSEYNFNYRTLRTGSFAGLPLTSKNSFRVWVANYTSFLTNNLTLHAMFGKVHGEFPLIQPAYPGFDPEVPGIASASLENPAFTPHGPISNSQISSTIADPLHRATEMSYRLSIDYKWENNDFQVGIDNLQTWDVNDGQVMAGPGYVWTYGQGNPSTPIVGTDPNLPPFAGPPDANGPNPNGYYVAKTINNLSASTRVLQTAEYIEDHWQITPRLLLDLGLRDDQFTNYNSAGVPFVKETKPQWAPRLGFSWDVHGNSTLKVFGNAGRYYLALPAALGFNAAASAIQTSRYFTYTGIDPATGVPTGLTQIPENNGGHPGFGVAPFNAYGQPVNPKQVSAQNLHAEYSDNFVLGMEQQVTVFGSKYVLAANGLFQKMGPYIIDDWDDTHTMCRAALSSGVVYAGATADDRLTDCLGLAQGFMLINPTEPNTMLITGDDGKLHEVTITAADQAFGQKVKRNYYALNLSMTHPFDGRWFGKVTYTWSRVYGNTEGPVDSYTGQGGTSVGLTEQWDFPQLMQWDNGPMPNNHTNALKAYGFYQIDPEWRVGGNLYISSGTPVICLGLFGPRQTDPVGYGNAYHWCGGKPRPPGSLGSTPWVHQLSLNVGFSPKSMHHEWDFKLSVFNVFNSQTPTLFANTFGSTGAPNPSFGLVEARTPPRFVRLSAAFNF